MFTGIIEEVGTVVELATGERGGHVRIGCQRLLPRLEVGSSVAVSGCCLTVVARDAAGFACDLAPETLNRTGFRRLRVGSQVNLEAPLTLATPLSGHVVQGHVDGTGAFLGLTPAGENNWWLDVEVPAELTRYLVEKASVAVEGISLTVAALAGAQLRIAIIPYTWENTNLRSLAAGDPVNLECDVLAKYVEKLLEAHAATISQKPANAPAASRLTLVRLLDEGF